MQNIGVIDENGTVDEEEEDKLPKYNATYPPDFGLKLRCQLIEDEIHGRTDICHSISDSKEAVVHNIEKVCRIQELCSKQRAIFHVHNLHRNRRNL